MEITFGWILGGGLGLGVWLSRNDFDQTNKLARVTQSNAGRIGTTISADIDCYIAVAMVWIIGCWNFLSIPQLDYWANRALPIGLLPLFGILGGRLFPYLFALPIVAMPIAGKNASPVKLRTDAFNCRRRLDLVGRMPTATAHVRRRIFLAKLEGTDRPRLFRTVVFGPDNVDLFLAQFRVLRVSVALETNPRVEPLRRGYFGFPVFALTLTAVLKRPQFGQDSPSGDLNKHHNS